jgi:hypothetical protein
MESAKEAGAADAARQGVRTAILANRLETIARKMANTLFRTARSGLINTARDLSCCIVTANHELLAEAESLPSHVLIGPDIMSRTLAAHHPAPRRGDAFLHNSPYHGNSHAADHTIMVPVIDDAGVHLLTALAKAHQADCGNAAPTSYFGTGHPQRQIHPLLPTQQVAKASAVLVGDLELYCVQVELSPHADLGHLDVSDRGIAGRILPARVIGSHWRAPNTLMVRGKTRLQPRSRPALQPCEAA